MNLKNYDLDDEIVELKIANKELATELGFKKEKIDKLEYSLEAIEHKLDKLIERSEERDNINEKYEDNIYPFKYENVEFCPNKINKIIALIGPAAP